VINCKQNLQKIELIKSGYESLRKNLQELVQKTSHSVMAPICHNMTQSQDPIAFIKGKIDHTNEILVLLGDNWFVERSVHQGLEIIDRRIEACKEREKKWTKEIESLQEWLKFSREFEKEKKEFVEIVEEYNEEEDKRWREEHRKKVREFRRKMREEDKENL